MATTTAYPMAKAKRFFARRVRQLRTDAGLSQQKVADLAGLSVSAVRMFEYGTREPTFATLVKLAGALGVELSAFAPPKGTKK